ncbi:BMP family lipoprotein [Halanaerobium praevalens]|uniref:Basic membrane lipoprotein n=1 Tax=Halanaerobium praevalens (strain ATCC 33744 / DSM 2228 / GSL) TaxID=572479 RepID=E3DQZ8_HALPG|nr:BMP family ABC transporter substrate-binding protein [Halanaerobium praevalens]ADO77987.1 basic membrane lipoprotein [Halanaerobium praevalens DSM 2228]
MKKFLFLTLALFFICSSAVILETEAVQAESELKVALVVSGGLGDRSFYDSAAEGVEWAEEDFGIDSRVLECRNDPSLFRDRLIQGSMYGDVVIVVGFEFYDVVQTVAPEFPEVEYIYVDNTIEDQANITSIVYKENEGSFLAGALAAMMTTKTEVPNITAEKIIGMVGGMDIPVIRNFQVGYQEGAKYVDSETKVETVFAGDFEDPAQGKESALTLFSQGADIVFAAAGKTGEGVFQAAGEKDNYVIGVDADQRYINPEVIIASVVKAVNVSVYESIERIIADELNSGSLYTYGLEEEGVYIGYGTEEMNQIVPAEIKEKVQVIKEQIISGEIEVPTAY